MLGAGGQPPAAFTPSPECAVLFGHLDRQEQLALDFEGRCMLTDHGAFVLFNVYGPALSDAEKAEERFRYKMDFFQVSRRRHGRLLGVFQAAGCIVSRYVVSSMQ